MATRHDNRNRRPVRNALLKWQLQQDQRRIEEVQYRLMRMAASSPLSSLSVENSKFDRRLLARRPRPVHNNDPDEDALMALINERDNQETNSSNDRIDHFKSSEIQRLPCLEPSKDSSYTSLQNISLRSTGKKINSAGDFYSPVRPRELNNSSSDVRQNLTFSRTKASAPERMGGKSATTIRRDSLRCNEMKTPDRWRTTAMQSNQEDVKESVVKKWDEEDVLHAERLLEKAARDGDNDMLWNDLCYGTKPLRAKTKQLSEQPAMSLTSDFSDVVSSSSHYKTGLNRNKLFMKGDEEMVPSELSTVSISAQTKPSTTKRSDLESSTADINGMSIPTSGQTISDMFVSMDQLNEVDSLDTDLLATNGQNYDGTNGSDKERVLCNELSTNDVHFARVRTLFGAAFPEWSFIVVVCCLVVGTSGFFIDDLLTLTGLLSKRAQFSLSRVEQKRMVDCISVLQQELQGFQLTTLKIEMESQSALAALRQYMNKLRLDREKHQNMLAKEMHELHHNILHIRHELVMQEQESVQAHLKEMIEVGNVNDHNGIDGAADVENEKLLEDTKTEAPIQVKSSQIIPNSHFETIASTEQLEMEQTKPNPSHDTTTMIEKAVITSSPLSHEYNELALLEQAITESDEKTDSISSPLLNENPGRVQSSAIKLETQSVVNEVNVEHVERVESALLPASGESISKMDVTVSPTLEVANSPYNASGTSWNKILILVILSLMASVLLRIYNKNRRKRWFEERQKRRNRRALRLAQRRARAIAANLDDSDDSETEEVSLMTPPENDDTRPQQQRQAFDVNNNRHSERKSSMRANTFTKDKISRRKASLRSRHRQDEFSEIGRRGDI